LLKSIIDEDREPDAREEVSREGENEEPARWDVLGRLVNEFLVSPAERRAGPTTGAAARSRRQARAKAWRSCPSARLGALTRIPIKLHLFRVVKGWILGCI
jgi:hypothetical protein